MFSSKSRKILIIEMAIVLIYMCAIVFLHFHPTYVSNYDGMKLSLFYIITAIVLFDLYLYFKTLSNANKTTWLVVIAVTFLSSLPLFFKGINYDGHDIAFHIYRIEAIVHEIKAGHIPARIYSMWNNGYGYPAPIYYGDILLYFPAVLRLLGFSVTSAYKIFIFSINLFTSIISVVCFGKMFKDKLTVYAMTFAFCLTPYRFTDLYARHAVGEYCAMLFFPLVAMAFWRIYQDNNKRIKNNTYSGILLAVGMTGIVLTHVLSVEMVSFTLFLFFLVLYRKSFHKDVILTLAIAIIFTALLSAFFLVPFLDYFTSVPIMSSVNVSNGVKIQDSGISIAEIFTFFAADPESNVQLTPGITLIITLFVSLFAVEHKNNKAVKILSALSCLFLIMSTNIFPWNMIATVKIVNILTQVQFPWRYLEIACATLTLLLGYILSGMSKSELSSDDSAPLNAIRLSISSIIISVISALVFVSLFSFNPSMAEYDLQNTFYAPGAREYARISLSENNHIETDYSLYSGEILGNYIDANILTQNGTDMSLYIKNGSSDTEIVLPRTNYPGYKITDDDNNSYQIYDSDNLTVAFTLPAYYDGNIYLTFVTPWYWAAAIIVSLCTLVLLTITYIKLRRSGN